MPHDLHWFLGSLTNYYASLGEVTGRKKQWEA